jgi:hypothetical protein
MDAAIVIRVVREILWSANSDPKAAADEDYALIESYCRNHRFVNPGKSGGLEDNLFAMASLRRGRQRAFFPLPPSISARSALQRLRRLRRHHLYVR